MSHLALELLPLISGMIMIMVCHQQVRRPGALYSLGLQQVPPRYPIIRL
jgi:hypothetical protein